MGWFFEIESGVGLTDTVMNGLSPGEGDIDGGFDSFIEQMKKTNGDPDVSPLNSYDTMVVVPEDAGPQDPPPPEDPTEPPLQPPTRPEPLSPSGPPVDYTGLITVAEILSWLEWIGNYGPSTHMGGGNYDSLAEYLNGEWHFDVDPELIDTGGFYGEHGQGGYVNYDQFGTTNRRIGFGAASGMLIPVFSGSGMK